MLPRALRRRLITALLVCSGTGAYAQVDESSAQAAEPSTDDEEVITLSPFEVSAEADSGDYRASSTLAGTRVRTDLNDIASSLSIVTKQFLRDTGAKNSMDLLVYTTNTEVGGVFGNYGGVGSTFINGATEPDVTRPHENTRVRGLDSADNTRDYFSTDIPWDAFNVGRVDMQRGPNSILFGVGSPAGIINASVNTAGFKDSVELANRMGSFGSVRNSLDSNRVLIDDELAVRIAAVDDDTKYRQKPAYNHDKRIFGTVRWEPRLFKGSSGRTIIRGNIEHGDVKANRPHVMPPVDRITPFFDPDGINRTAYDTYYATQMDISVLNSGTTASANQIYWFSQDLTGVSNQQGTLFSFDYNSSALTSASQGAPGGSGSRTYWAIGADGTQDSAIGGYIYPNGLWIQGYSQYMILRNQYNPDDEYSAGAQAGLYKDKSITDPTIFDFYNNMLGGSTSRQWQGWDSFDISLEQTLFNNRVAVQLVYDRQDYDDGQEGIFGNYITVDCNANSASEPWPYSTSVTSYNGTGTAGTNENAGRACIVGNGTGSRSRSLRENFRATATGELRATDFMQDSWITRLLGRHVLTGMYSTERHDTESRNYMLYALEDRWADAVGSGPDAGGSYRLDKGIRSVDICVYLSDALFDATSASNLNIQPITANIGFSDSAAISYFNSRWTPSLDSSDASYVNPAAEWTNPVTGETSTQSENPANYAGWETGSYRILSANDGDIDSLYTSGTKLRRELDSKAITWQGYLWEDTLVGTFGWRKDTLKQRSGFATVSDVTGVASMEYGLNAFDPETGKSEDDSMSWGLVLHTPKALREKLPWGTNISLTYSDGENTRVQARYAFDASRLPNAKGRTKDYGFVINTLNDRLRVKVAWYKTTVKDANISSVLSSESTLGSNAYMLYAHPAWGLGDVLQAVAGLAGDSAADGFAYNWNWAQYSHTDDSRYLDVTSDEFLNDPETIAEKEAIAAFLDHFDEVFPQAWWDAYGYPVNVAEAKLGNYETAVDGWDVSQGNWMIRSSTNGTINGSAPVGTVDYQSKGVEIEVAGQPIRNLSLSINASKQTAQQIALGDSLSTFITKVKAFYDTPAGDIRLWWGGDQGLRDYFTQNIWAAYQFQAQTNGKMVPEMSPWRCNVVANYGFTQGRLKGANIGFGYRWQDGVILGYGLNAAKDNLDVNKPYWSDSEDAVDFWAGYERKLSDKVHWRIQFNARSIGTNPHLRPISVQPDGSAAGFRIVEGQTWELSNTFTF